MINMEPFSLNTILMVFGGGIVGTALGGLWAIILCALLGLIGCGILLTGGSDFVLAQIAFGPIFGPHTGGFGAGLMAGCYAVWKKNHPGGSAKDILSPLLHTSGDVLVVGGLLSVAAAPAGCPALAATLVVSAAGGVVVGVGWTAGAVGVATTGGVRFEITMAIVVPTRTTSRPTTPTMIQTNWGTELC